MMIDLEVRVGLLEARVNELTVVSREALDAIKVMQKWVEELEEVLRSELRAALEE